MSAEDRQVVTLRDGRRLLIADVTSTPKDSHVSARVVGVIDARPNGSTSSEGASA